MRTRDYTAQNRRAWNEIELPRRGKATPARFFRAGKICFNEAELAEIGDVRDKRVLNLQCSFGNDALSFASLGADVTGVDISDEVIAFARTIAEDAALRARFVAADVYALPPDLQAQDFDLVFSKEGFLCWLPDIEEWARIVAAALKPGGRLMLIEHHPLTFSLEFSERGIDVARDYFGRTEPVPIEGGLGRVAFNAPSSEDYYQFNWPLGDVVTALIRAGLRIDKLEEFAGEPPYVLKSREDLPVPPLARRLPQLFMLLASKGV